MTLEAVEFIRRFLWHILPRGFMQFPRLCGVYCQEATVVVEESISSDQQ
jgi:hypothetical protein